MALHPIAAADRELLRPLFTDFPGLHGAIEAVLEGSNGDAYADDTASPGMAKLVLEDFHMLAGDPAGPRASAALASVPDGDHLAVPEAWEGLLWDSGRPMLLYERFSFGGPHPWDREQLHALRARLPDGLVLEPVTSETVKAFAALNQSFVGNFRSLADFLERGVGFGVREERSGEFVAGCSSFAISTRSLEFEIETREDYQRRGLALITGSALIEYCLDRNLEPCWDAAHEGSAVLAERLGFAGRRAYLAYRMG